MPQMFDAAQQQVFASDEDDDHQKGAVTATASPGEPIVQIKDEVDQVGRSSVEDSPRSSDRNYASKEEDTEEEKYLDEL